MATDWANLIDWGAGVGVGGTGMGPGAEGWGSARTWRTPSEFDLARGMASLEDHAARVSKFAPVQQNADLLSSLGFGGAALQGITDPEFGFQSQQWSPEALDWLDRSGYQLAVGHEPGTSSGGRSEYFALMDPSGKYVQGQTDPTRTTSDTLMDQIIPFAMLAGPFLSAAGAIGGGAGAAGGVAGSGSTGLAAGEGLTALGSSWSPQALGLTGSVGSGLTAAELASLSAALPSAVEIGAAGLGGAGLAGAAGGGGVTATLPTQVITGTSAGSAAGGALPTLGQVGSAVGGVSSAEQLFQQAADEALASSGNYYQQNPMEQWMTDVSNVADIKGGGLLDYVSTGAQNLPNVPGASSIKDLLGTASNVVGGGNNLAGLIGGVIGATQGGDSETQSRDPWSAAQPFLKNILADAEAQRANLAANPFTQQQTQAYQNAYGGLDQARSALPGLLSWGQNAMQRQSSTPTYASLFGGQPQQTPQPTMQAGGVGGLLGGSQDDRLKALMARGRGLLG
jgi:hypothetical protein